MEVKIETGKRELDKEIDADLKKLVEVGEPKKASSESNR
jgi:hypothetical protein